MNTFLTFFGLIITGITAIIGILGHIGILLTIGLAITGLIGPLFAHLNRQMDQQEKRTEREN